VILVRWIINKFAAAKYLRSRVVLFCAIWDHADGFTIEDEEDFFFWMRVRQVR